MSTLLHLAHDDDPVALSPAGLPAGPSAGRPAGHPPADVRLARTTAAFRAFLETLGLDLDDANLVGTDQRVARAYRELFAGLEPGAEPRLSTFPNSEGYAEIVSLTNIPFYSLCSHHFLPFFGTAHVGYVPGRRILGLSKLARVVEFYARRPQLQERLTQQVATLIDERVAPAGVIVVLEARHLCMEMRGVSAPGVTTSTIAVRGTLGDEALRNRFLAGVRDARTEPAGRVP
jgi:GTP cyclohydrolase I